MGARPLFEPLISVPDRNYTSSKSYGWPPFTRKSFYFGPSNEVFFIPVSM